MRALLAIMHYKRMGARGVGDGDHRAVSGCEGRHGGRNTVLTIRTICAVGAGRTHWTLFALCTLLSIMHHKSVRTRNIRDGDHCAVAGCEGRHCGRITVLTIHAVGTVGAISACRSHRTLLSIMQHKSMGTRGIGDGDHRAVAGREGRHCGRKTGRTCRALLAVMQQIALAVAVRHRQHQHIAGVGRCHRKSRHVVGAACIQCVRYTQQLLHTFNTIVNTARRVNFRLQVERALSPRNLGEVLAGVAATHLHGQQAVDVGGGSVRLRINDRTRGTAL